MGPLFSKYFPNVIQYQDEIIQGIKDTLEMLVKAGGYSFIFGIIFGTILVITRKGGLKENKVINWIISQLVNLIRAIPFIILLVFMKPLTRIVMGTSIQVQGVIFPLIVGCTPFFIRQVELALSDIDPGLIEAAQSMGLSTFEIIVKVYLRESIPALVRSAMITLISLLGLTAMGGAVGGGGIGDLVIKLGNDRNMGDITNFSIVVIIIIVLVIQSVGSYILKKTKH